MEPPGTATTIDVLTLGVPIGLQWTPWRTPSGPYLELVPELTGSQVRVDPSSRTSSSRNATFGVLGLVGTQLSTTVGVFFIEAGYRYAASDGAGLAAALGYRGRY